MITEFLVQAAKIQHRQDRACQNPNVWILAGMLYGLFPQFTLSLFHSSDTEMRTVSPESGLDI